MKLYFVVLLALVASSQASTFNPLSMLPELTGHLTEVRCASQWIFHYIQSECQDLDMTACYEKAQDEIPDAIRTCFGSEDGTASADRGSNRASMDILACVGGDILGLLAGKTNNPLEVFSCLLNN